MQVVKSSQNNISLRQANALTTAAYNLTVNEKRIVYLAIEKALSEKDKLDYSSLPFGQFPVYIDNSNFSERFGLDKSNSSRDIRAAVTGLQKKIVTFFLPEEDGSDGEKALDDISWTVKSAIRPKKGMTTVFFNAELMKIITEVDVKFTKFLLSEAANISNQYCMRLFESLSQYKSFGKAVFRSSWMIERYSLPPSYKRMSDFRRRFLNPSVEEISHKSDFLNLKYTEEKKLGDTLITFIWDKSSPKKSFKSPQTTLEIAVNTFMRLSTDYDTGLITKEDMDCLRSEWVHLVIEGFEMSLIEQKFKAITNSI